MTISTRIGTSLYNYIYSTSVTKQGVALTGQNYAGPPWNVTDDDRHQKASPVWPSYTLCVGGPVYNNNATVKTSTLLQFVFNNVHHSLVRHTAADASRPLVDTVINEPLRHSAPPQLNRLLQLFRVLAFWRPPTNNIKLLCFATCVQNCCCTQQKSSNYSRAFKNYKPKRHLVPLLVKPPCRGVFKYT